VLVASSGVTPDRFAATMRRLETVAPIELNDALVIIGKMDVLPGARARAGGGRLAASLSVVPGAVAKGAALKSTKPYANVQHWGGYTWYAQSRKGRWPNPVPRGKSIAGKRYVQDQIEANQARITRDLGDALDRMMLKHFGGA
jgi:hypothetical protein